MREAFPGFLLSRLGPILHLRPVYDHFFKNTTVAHMPVRIFGTSCTSRLKNFQETNEYNITLEEEREKIKFSILKHNYY